MRRSARWAVRLAVVVAGLLGAALIAVFVSVGSTVIRYGVHELGDDSALAARGRTAVGTVLSRRTIHTSPLGGDVEKMIVRFTATDGTPHEVSVNGHDPVGSRVRIHYDPAHPDAAVTEPVAGRRFLAGALILVGVVAILGPPGLILKLSAEMVLDHRRNRRKAAAA